MIYCYKMVCCTTEDEIITHIGDEYTGIGEESLIQQIENDIYTIETKEEAAKYSEEYGADLDELLDFMKIGGNTNGN